MIAPVQRHCSTILSFRSIVEASQRADTLGLRINCWKLSNLAARITKKSMNYCQSPSMRNAGNASTLLTNEAATTQTTKKRIVFLSYRRRE